MLDPPHPIAKLLKEDPRYKLDAYAFVFHALEYAQQHLGMGREVASEPLSGQSEEQEPRGPERHLTGQELCEAARRLALEQFGYMAHTVLKTWGIHSTSDIGEIVYNLIRVGQMRKTPQDRREDFDNVFDFETALREQFRFEPSD